MTERAVFFRQALRKFLIQHLEVGICLSYRFLRNSRIIADSTVRTIGKYAVKARRRFLGEQRSSFHVAGLDDMPAVVHLREAWCANSIAADSGARIRGLSLYGAVNEPVTFIGLNVDVAEVENLQEARRILTIIGLCLGGVLLPCPVARLESGGACSCVAAKYRMFLRHYIEGILPSGMYFGVAVRKPISRNSLGILSLLEQD
jgi:hypothetical protein